LTRSRRFLTGAAAVTAPGQRRPMEAFTGKFGRQQR
jgi:hypothetical protein